MRRLSGCLVALSAGHFVLLTALIICISASFVTQAAEISFVKQQGKVQLCIDGKSVATYVYDDPNISRPYFAKVCSPGRIQVTRNLPPIAGQDRMDHPEFHPGIWLAFGDLSGNDYWRLKSRVVHIAFHEAPHVADGVGAFAVENHYLDTADPGQIMCRELCRYTLRVLPAGYLLTWDSTFTSDREFYFGDQEEMGLGVRVATPLRAERKTDGGLLPGNGTVVDAVGRHNEAEIWGNAAAWCDYSGETDGQSVGITIFCHPENFRPSWWHVRDYGFITANPFGRAALRQGPESQVVVKPGEKLRLRFGVLMHGRLESLPEQLSAAYQAYAASDSASD